MAVGKNKGLTKGIKKVGKKKVDSYSRKDWYDVKAPNVFAARNICKTLVNRSQGLKVASDFLKGRVFEVSLSDLQKDTDCARSYRKFRFIAEDVQDRNVLTNFHGMDLTSDKCRSLVKKWQTLIESTTDVKTTDGYLLRIFCIGFTDNDPRSHRKKCYAQQSQVRRIRLKMNEIINKEIICADLKEVMNKLVFDSITKYIEKSCGRIYPLHNVYIRKVKVLKKPRFDFSKLMELHGDGGSGSKSENAVSPEGDVVSRPDFYEPPVQEYV